MAKSAVGEAVEIGCLSLRVVFVVLFLIFGLLAILIAIPIIFLIILAIPFMFL